MVTPYLGEVRMFAGNFAPSGWALCAGGTLPINQYAALYSLLGTTYGGDGINTFGLPDFRGRVAVSQGQGASLSSYVLGQAYGVETVTLATTNIPAHIHPLNASSTTPPTSLTPTPANTMTIAKPAAGNNCYAVASQNPAIAQLNPSDVVAGGGGQPHNNIMPVLAVTYIIALEGIYPTN
jgi:microcystin-dependent protein